jgi:hypothetical protein
MLGSTMNQFLMSLGEELSFSSLPNSSHFGIMISPIELLSSEVARLQAEMAKSTAKLDAANAKLDATHDELSAVNHQLAELKAMFMNTFGA